MTEDQYWQQLRLVFNHQAQSDLGGWCDWFEPTRYGTSSAPPCVDGKVGFVDGAKVTEWRFRLLLDQAYRCADDVRWSRQLPTLETEWYQLDRGDGVLKIIAGGAS